VDVVVHMQDFSIHSERLQPPSQLLTRSRIEAPRGQPPIAHFRKPPQPEPEPDHLRRHATAPRRAFKSYSSPHARIVVRFGLCIRPGGGC
jgi:hypothetical protein